MEEAKREDYVVRLRATGHPVAPIEGLLVLIGRALRFTGWGVVAHGPYESPEGARDRLNQIDANRAIAQAAVKRGG